MSTGNQRSARRTDPQASPVLVVDDDAGTRMLIAQFLAELGLCNPVVQASDGEEARELLAQEAFLPALALLDLHMPKRSGLDVLRGIRGTPRTAGVPVVVLTGSAELEEVDETYALGISAYLVKPVGFAALRDVITQMGLPWTLLAGSGSGSGSELSSVLAGQA